MASELQEMREGDEAAAKLPHADAPALSADASSLSDVRADGRAGVETSAQESQGNGTRRAGRLSRASVLPVVVWCVLTLIWGSTWAFIKIGLEDLPPVSFAAIRFVISASLLFLIAALRRARMPKGRREWALIALTGVLAFAVNYGLIFWGEQHISSGLAALLQTTIPVFGLLIAHVHLPGERLTTAKLCGVLLGVVGVGIIFSNQLSARSPLALWGSAAIVVGAFGAAYANVLVKAYGGRFDPSVLAGAQMIFGLVPLLFVGLSVEGNPLRFRWTTMAVVSLLYLAIVGSTVAFLLYYWLVRNMDVTKTMLIALVTPLIAVALGIVVLDEHLTWRVLAGGACIMAGVGLIVARRLRRA